MALCLNTSIEDLYIFISTAQVLAGLVESALETLPNSQMLNQMKKKNGNACTTRRAKQCFELFCNTDRLNQNLTINIATW
jgi:hypothetical protein